MIEHQLVPVSREASKHLLRLRSKVHPNSAATGRCSVNLNRFSSSSFERTQVLSPFWYGLSL